MDKMTNLSEMLKSVEPEVRSTVAGPQHQWVDRASYDRMKAIAVRLAEAIEDNKSASELGFQVYPLEKTILKALADCAKMLEEK